ncbi:hypothetical protein KCMC57_up57760 [Kitasatospora sp. CMC57]|uniref:STAS domain-containing protein n=1 Tax=Kitasatospora sp. CMC57 TaxID=3231513 RepID=A0AB33K9E6_9ACTN
MILARLGAAAPVDCCGDEGRVPAIARSGFRDSSGVNLLLQSRLRVQEAGHALRLATVSGPGETTLELTGASQVFCQYAGVADAFEVS